MYSVVIADDEINIGNGIADVLKAHCPELVIKGVFYNGQDLAEFLSKNYVHIVISDIRMPKVNGLDIAKLILQKKLDTHIIIITGYKDFEYAKKAIDYRVDALLLKPFAFKDLIAKIREIEEKISINTTHIFNETQLYLLDWEKFRKTLSDVFLCRCPIPDIFELSFVNELVAAADFHCYEITYFQENFNDRHLLQAAKDFGEFYAKDLICCNFAHTDTELRFLLLYCGNDPLEQTLQDVCQAFQLHFEIRLTYQYSAFDSLPDWAAFCQYRQITNTFFAESAEKGLASAKTQLAEILSSLSDSQLTGLYHYILTLEDKSSTPQPDAKINADHILQLLQSMLSLTDYKQSKSDVLVAKARQYILENYKNANLSLNEIAAALSVNPNYLGQIIKKTSGQRFVDILLQTRMEQARNLLIQTNIPIKQIALDTGFNKESYFRSQFKRYFNITPSRFRSKNL